jgi:dinuclear metal center YbgI/SA1388 family protein
MARKKVTCNSIAGYLDKLLKIDSIEDYKGAVNGLQVENLDRITKVVAAVDASLSTIQLAVEADADLMIIHHGLFWSPVQPWTGRRYELIRTLIDNNVAIYSAHLPLDVHPKYGNNALLAKGLGFSSLKPFFAEKGSFLGVQAEHSISLTKLTKQTEKLLGQPPVVIPGGPATCKRIGIVTGGAGSEIARAAKEGVDTFISGEAPHWAFALAEDLGINVILGGHYLTETFGVKAIAAHLADKFGLDHEFIDYPTGL